ncbi:MAG: hypothetical protein LBS89_05080 [Zoogloeaceae bacterium]|nr:hypothetical protein [Zoogloeaceae bacterium]
MRIRDIAAPIASEEKEQERQVAEIRERETRDQKRRETALLSTYASLEDIDKMQAQAESGLKKDIAEAEEKTADAQKRLQDLQETAKLYEGKTMPADLSSNLQNEEMQVKYQSELIRLKKRDLKEVQQKYATDKRRYKEITRQKNP